ncbi:MATE family efflux transporter [Piscinibacter sakaiensis]|uniref:Na+-driven multidrug efflux pump n=1 Tax=Piscinibacter sakaiensis TaxID=1547922 RepID=A0A0K8P5V5_PISS1|nr:MATE family efflux transporter [Piscinibacter sakaiensis]GAP37992.1 Na+-driven multidrug efflux pump [Piscinibacter sakaiensis]
MIPPGAPPVPGFRDSLRRIAPLAWPVFVGQVSVVAFGTVDTLFVARHAAADLAALSVGAAAYVTVFIGLMGVVLAVSPIAGRLFGAGRLAEAGGQLHQAVWIALALALLGSTLLVFPAPFLALSKAPPEVAAKVRGYLLALSLSLPASLLFAAFRGFNTAVSRPKAVMVLQLGGLLAVKLPLTALLVFGWPAAGLPALGVLGCGLATAAAMWAQLLAGAWLLRRDPFYAPFALPLAPGRPPLRAPDGAAIRAQLRLGVPMGLTILVEVTGFAFMAIFIARLGTTAVAGHQIAANLVALMFMMPLALGNATGTLVAQAIGAQAGERARRIGWHGLWLGSGIALAMGLAVFAARGGVVRLYTGDAAVIAAALPLLAWMALFHFADAVQGIAAFVLRAWHVATVPVVIFVMALWGVGLGGGYWLAFDPTGVVPPGLSGAPGYWAASTAGLVLAALGLTALLAHTVRRGRGGRVTPGG